MKFILSENVATALGYEYTAKAIKDHVEEDDKNTLEKLAYNGSF